ncbi:MAG: hypothetical protein OEV55_00490, partial [candidate division Zixibacteria bacterium]|nr:hypothetical protein [candidate division Zixibacteria bacterium]
LSTEDKAILKSSGEDRDKAFKDGGQYVGTAKGDYVILIDTLGNPYYQYTGRDSGDYLVSFSWSGDSRGSYAYKGGGIYSYVYPGNGDYLPRIDLPLPSGHSILDLCLNLIPFDGFSSEIGWGLSRKDNNLFSGLDEGDNSGKAFFLKAGYEKQSPSIMDYTLSEIKLEGLYRSTGQNFSPFGRLDEVERERVWGMLNDSTKSPEDVFRFKGLVAPRENLVLNTDLGMMKKGAYFESSRNRFEIIYSPFKSLKAKVSSEDVNSTTREESANLRGNWQRDIFHLTHRWRKLNTEIGWEREEQKFTPEDSAKTGSRFDEFKGKINLKSNTLWDLSSLFIFREEKQKDVVWKKESFSYTWQNGLSLRNYKEVLSSRIEHIHRQKSFKTGENSKGDIGNFKLDYQSRNQALVLNLYYSANLSGAEKRIDNYLEVGEGRGDYRYENGEYIPDSEGSFILQQEILDDYIPGKKLDRSFRTVFKPGKLFPHIIFLKEFYSESIVKTSNLVVKEVDWTSFIFNPLNKGFGGDEQFRDFSSRHDFYLFPSAPLNLRLRWVEEERENLLLLTGKDKDFKKGQSILLRYRFSHNNSIESELLNDERERFKIDSNLLILKGKSIRVDFTRREGNSLEMTLSGRARKEKNEKSEITANIFELSPRLSYSLLNKGKIRSVFSWCRVTSSPQNSILPWEMAEGKKAGDNFGWRFGFDFGLNQTISAIFDYTGSKEPVRGTRHNGKIEVRASF